MSLNVYQSLTAVYQLAFVRVNGRNVPIKFSGGQKSPKLIRGRFITTDAELQKAIENSPEYGKKWIRIVPPHGVIAPVVPPDGNLELEQAPAEEQPPAEITVKVIKTDEPVAESPAPVKSQSVPGIVNAQQAKEYLLRQNLEGVTFKSIMRKEQIYAAAVKFGFTFPDWDYQPQ